MNMGIRIVDTVEMLSIDAFNAGHDTMGWESSDCEGYEVTYAYGEKAWFPKEVEGLS